MAPSYSDDEVQESQIPPWAESRVQDLEVRPSFTNSQPGQPFGFKLPSQATTTSAGARSVTSSSLLSSSNPSIFSAPISRGSSVASSHPVSECGSNGAYQKRDGRDGSQSALPKRLSQLRMLATVENHTSDVPQRNSRVHTHASQSFSGTTVQGQLPVCDDDPPSPPPRPVGLRRTQSFSRLPLATAESHTMFVRNTESGVDPGEDDLIIDEVSPSEDDRFAEAIVRGESESHHCYARGSRWLRCLHGDPSHGDQLGEASSQFNALESQGDYPHGSTTTQQSKLRTVGVLC